MSSWYIWLLYRSLRFFAYREKRGSADPGPSAPLCKAAGHKSDNCQHNRCLFNIMRSADQIYTEPPGLNYVPIFNYFSISIFAWHTVPQTCCYWHFIKHTPLWWKKMSGKWIIYKSSRCTRSLFVYQDHFRTDVKVSFSSRFPGWIIAPGGKVKIVGLDETADQMK